MALSLNDLIGLKTIAFFLLLFLLAVVPTIVRFLILVISTKNNPESRVLAKCMTYMDSCVRAIDIVKRRNFPRCFKYKHLMVLEILSDVRILLYQKMAIYELIKVHRFLTLGLILMVRYDLIIIWYHLRLFFFKGLVKRNPKIGNDIPPIHVIKVTNRSDESDSTGAYDANVSANGVAECVEDSPCECNSDIITAEDEIEQPSDEVAEVLVTQPKNDVKSENEGITNHSDSCNEVVADIPVDDNNDSCNEVVADIPVDDNNDSCNEVVADIPVDDNNDSCNEVVADIPVDEKAITTDKLENEANEEDDLQGGNVDSGAIKAADCNSGADTNVNIGCNCRTTTIDTSVSLDQGKNSNSNIDGSEDSRINISINLNKDNLNIRIFNKNININICKDDSASGNVNNDDKSGCQIDDVRSDKIVNRNIQQCSEEIANLTTDVTAEPINEFETATNITTEVTRVPETITNITHEAKTEPIKRDETSPKITSEVTKEDEVVTNICSETTDTIEAFTNITADTTEAITETNRDAEPITNAETEVIRDIITDTTEVVSEVAKETETITSSNTEATTQPTREDTTIASADAEVTTQPTEDNTIANTTTETTEAIAETTNEDSTTTSATAEAMAETKEDKPITSSTRAEIAEVTKEPEYINTTDVYRPNFKFIPDKNRKVSQRSIDNFGKAFVRGVKYQCRQQSFFSGEAYFRGGYHNPNSAESKTIDEIFKMIFPNYKRGGHEDDGQKHVVSGSDKAEDIPAIAEVPENGIGDQQNDEAVVDEPGTNELGTEEQLAAKDLGTEEQVGAKELNAEEIAAKELGAEEQVAINELGVEEQVAINELESEESLTEVSEPETKRFNDRRDSESNDGSEMEFGYNPKNIFDCYENFRAEYFKGDPKYDYIYYSDSEYEYNHRADRQKKKQPRFHKKRDDSHLKSELGALAVVRRLQKLRNATLDQYPCGYIRIGTRYVHFTEIEKNIKKGSRHFQQFSVRLPSDSE
ncbi:conserved hypothetical protein [Theileria orientalis strain Shintoku]|uniref:Uncharacterized protein n=1 Tax=Theileria orientalis strain Shintoku TaxID=869250 RepID=J4DPV6_THEOR|nr:conserved hypothetical protein [Theileria orientalis strain Shintoku]BAM41369.1 conserved hypothetical protein [Theileria orientalis strain Shintoku]|eukprot:XP_009691670.1 conserved hypothetical protein [Theileria orientalis strain Shintoku]